MNTHWITRDVAFRAATEAYTHARRLGYLPSEAIKISNAVERDILQIGRQVNDSEDLR